MTVLSNNRQSLRLIFGFNHHPVPAPPASFISLTFTPNRFFGTFLTQESTVLLPRPCSHNKNPRRDGCLGGGKGMLV